MKCRLIKGFFRVGATKHKKGAVLDLTKSQFEAFKDRFESLEEREEQEEMQPEWSDLFAVSMGRGVYHIFSKTQEKRITGKKGINKKELGESFPEIEIFKPSNCLFDYEGYETE